MSLQTPTDDGAAALANLGIEVYDAEGNMRSMIDIIGDFQTSMEGMTDAEKTDTISQIFNKTDIASVNALLNTSSARFEELSGAIGDATGSAQAMADVQLDNFNGQITLLKSALEGAAIAIGEKLTPYVSALVEKVQGAVDWFNSLSDSQQDLIVKIGLVVAAIGPALVIVGKIVSVVGSITSAVGSFITFIPTLTAALTAVGACITGTVIPAIVSVVTAIAPFLLIGAAIAAVIAGIILVVKNWGAITEWIGQKWQEFCDFIMPVLQSIGEFFASIFEKIKEDITTKWTLIKNFTTLLWNAIKSFITNTLNGIKTTFTNIFNTVKTTVTNVFNNIKNAISTKLTEAVNTVKTKLSNIKQSFLDLKDAAITWGKDMIDNFINGIKSKFNAVKDTITDLASSIKDIIGFSEPKNGPLSRFHTFAPDMMELFMEGIRENEKALQAQVATTFGGAFTPTDNITVTSNNSEVLNMLSEVLNVLPSLANSQIVLDSGVLVGETAPQMNVALGQLYINEQRSV
jgi:phage-related protein